MTSFTIKGIPDELYRRLKRRATLHRRSLNSEILVSLEEALIPRPVDPAALLARADRVRESLTIPS